MTIPRGAPSPAAWYAIVSFTMPTFAVDAFGALQRQGEGWTNRLLIEGSVPISSIGTDEQGNLYAAGHLDGVIYALISPAEKSE